MQTLVLGFLFGPDMITRVLIRGSRRVRIRGRERDLKMLCSLALKTEEERREGHHQKALRVLWSPQAVGEVKALLTTSFVVGDGKGSGTLLWPDLVFSALARWEPALELCPPKWSAVQGQR